jgi:hypothetical protein
MCDEMYDVYDSGPLSGLSAVSPEQVWLQQ